MKTTSNELLRVAALLISLFFITSPFAQETDGDVTPPDTMDSDTMDMDMEQPLSPGQEQVIDKLASEFEDFAGSEENADALVRGLRTGSSISLVSDDMAPDGMDGMDGMDGASEVTIDNETSYGYGNVSHILTLAEAQLSDMGIEDPTPEQIEAVLRGGDIDIGDADNPETVTLEGILSLRESGMGYGEISQELGLGPFGQLVAAKKRGFGFGDNSTDGDGTDDVNGTSTEALAKFKPAKSQGLSDDAGDKPHGKPESVANLNKGPKVERPVKVEKPEKPVKPEKISRPERPQRPEKVARPERPEKPQKPERPGKG
ncbi:MAG: hypothetical protein P8X93_00400 [Gammaproteobacteria bacterium]|jgi:hypothetical protein